MGLGTACLELGEYENALKAFDLCLKVYSNGASPRPQEIQEALYLKAAVYENLGDHANANKFYLKSLEQFEPVSKENISLFHMEALARYILFL